MFGLHGSSLNGLCGAGVLKYSLDLASLQGKSDGIGVVCVLRWHILLDDKVNMRPRGTKEACLSEVTCVKGMFFYKVRNFSLVCVPNRNSIFQKVFSCR